LDEKAQRDARRHANRIADLNAVEVSTNDDDDDDN
jgi:hypothetical protein